MAQGELIADHVFLTLEHGLAVGDKTLLWRRERILEVDQDLFVTRMRGFVLCRWTTILAQYAQLALLGALLHRNAMGEKLRGLLLTNHFCHIGNVPLNFASDRIVQIDYHALRFFRAVLMADLTADLCLVHGDHGRLVLSCDLVG